MGKEGQGVLPRQSEREYDRVKGFLRLLDEPNRQSCLNMLEVNRERFMASPGSTFNHQAWPGGYIGHVSETMRFAVRFYDGLLMMASFPERNIPFGLNDALLIMFLHDLEKPWKYVDQLHFKTKADRHAFRLMKINEFGIQLNSEHENALRYVEGEFEDYSPHGRVMGPLAAFCHMCDIASARIWFDEPRQN